jgi:hypothetical protein
VSNQALIDIRAKIHRANRHCDDFKAEFGLGPRSTKQNVYPSGIHYEPNWTYIEVQTSRFPKIQRDVGLVLGDAVHQMRAGLDHVISYLVFQKTQSHSAMRKAQFPILRSPDDFEKHKSVKFLVDTFGESSREFTAIRESQPYENHPSAPTEDGLWLLGGLVVDGTDGLCDNRSVFLLFRLMESAVNATLRRFQCMICFG